MTERYKSSLLSWTFFYTAIAQKSPNGGLALTAF